ncbi:MAG: hypothetical protein HYT31_01815 [Parcubacteria group bacterium]|nr:hypothetical protein [Parcubacteria group bacterium]
MASFKQYYSAVRYLERLAASKHDQAYMHNRNDHPEQYVERTRELVKRLGNPCQGVRVIHVAGTAGKGTTTAYLHNILYKASHRVGSFTSPYATTSIEKIKVNDLLIGPNVFAALVGRIKPVVERMAKEYEYGRPSYFEIFFAASLLYFQKMRCDWIVLEVGCGGKYDAGMIFPKAIAAITNIGLDHTQLLGKTIPKIAKEKAGIIRKNSHVFTTEKRPSILKLFKKICRERNTKLHIIKPGPQVLPIHPGNAQPSYGSAGAGCSAESGAPAALASATNISLAAAIARHLKIRNDIINQAISNTSLPCRFEIVQTKPLVILDGAHNPMKIKNVVHNIKHLTYATLYTMFGCSSAKDAQRMVRQLAKVANEFIFTKPHGSGHTFYEPKKLAAMAKLPKRVQKNPKRALSSILIKLKPQDALLVTGSFYLAGAIRTHWISERTVLTKRNHA